MVFCAEETEAREGADHFLEQVKVVPGLKFQARSVEVLDTLEGLSDTGLAKRFQPIARTLPWSESHRLPGRGDQAALCDLNAVFAFRKLTVGLIYLNPNVEYPQHDHAPKELYLVLSGTADWKYGGNQDYRTVTAGNLIYNHPFDVHGVRNAYAPLLALYILWGLD